MTPRTDVCGHCEGFRVCIMTETKDYVELAQLERDFYLGCIRKGKD